MSGQYRQLAAGCLVVLVALFEEGLVLLPGEPGDGEYPEPDDGRVGREDLAVVLRGVAGLYDRDGLVLGQAGGLEPALRGVVEDNGAHRGDLALPGLLAGLCYVRRSLGGLYDQVIAGLLEAEVEVRRAVARGDAYPGLGGADLLRCRAEARGAGDLDVVPELHAGR